MIGTSEKRNQKDVCNILPLQKLIEVFKQLFLEEKRKNFYAEPYKACDQAQLTIIETLNQQCNTT